MGKQLVETLTDAAVMDASHISSAIELDGYYGVYETMTEYLNEYIDGFYKSSSDFNRCRFRYGSLVCRKLDGAWWQRGYV